MRNSPFPTLPDDHREHSRTVVCYEVDFDYYTLDGHKVGAGHGETLNVGAGGMMILTDELLEPSMQVLVQIITPLTIFIAKGTVVHANQVDEDLYRAGIRFTDMINAEWELSIADTP